MTLQELQQRFAAVEQRLDRLEGHIVALERLAAELRDLERMVGDLKFEVEEMQEA